MTKRSLASSIGKLRALWSTQTRISRGSRETEQTELAVIPWMAPSGVKKLMTLTPVGKLLHNARKRTLSSSLAITQGAV